LESDAQGIITTRHARFVYQKSGRFLFGCPTEEHTKVNEQTIDAETIVSETSENTADTTVEVVAETALVLVEGKEDEPMTPKETTRYNTLCTSIRKSFATGYKAAVAIGNALKEIQEQKLFRGCYASWDDFLEREFGGLKQNYASRQIRVAKLDAALEAGGVSLAMRPATESQARELLRVPDDNLVKALERAHQIAGQAPLTAEHFRRAAEEYGKSSGKNTTKNSSKSVGVAFSIGFNADTAQLILSHTGSQGVEMMSLSDLFRAAKIPEQMIREALYVCFEQTDPDTSEEESPETDEAATSEYGDKKDYRVDAMMAA
jgi:hypothetical protein